MIPTVDDVIIAITRRKFAHNGEHHFEQIHKQIVFLPVQLTSTTSYSHGAASEIANGVKVEVKGDVIDGVFVARKIDVEGDHGLPVHPPITPVTPPTPVTLPGKAAYDANCAGCHILGNYDISGFAPNLSGKGSLVSDKIVGGHKGISLSSQLLTALAAFVNAN